MSVQPFLIGSGWIETIDGDESGRTIFDRHYSRYRYKDGRKPKLYVGPGFKCVLLHATGLALFVWRKFRSLDHQEGVNCAIFRNEGAGLSSALILDAQAIADGRWPGERHYTYVCPRSLRNASEKGARPGACFEIAGWRFCGWTGSLLMIFESLPEWRGLSSEAASMPCA